MKKLQIEISEEMIFFEKNRPVSEMDFDAITWCFPVVFKFSENELVIEAPLFGFVINLYNSIRSAINSQSAVLLNDEDGSFQIVLTVEDDRINLKDEFGAGSVEMSLEELIENLNLSHRNAVSILENYIPELIENQNYFEIKNIISEFKNSGNQPQ